MVFGLVGGDCRQAELSRLLKADGHTVYTYGLERWGAVGAGTLERTVSAETVVLPLPLCKDEGVLNCEEMRILTMELFGKFGPEQTLLGGQIKLAQMQEASSCGLRLKDYFCREELTVANAAVTAEAAIQVAMERLDRTLLGMECLVLGFGRIGRLLSHRLHGMGARVTASARKPEDLAWIRAYGWNAIQTGRVAKVLPNSCAVFNTIPSLVLDAACLAKLPEECLCIDLASEQGIDLTAAESLGLQAVWARSLPGRLAPRTAAEAIRDTIYSIISEKE